MAQQLESLKPTLTKRQTIDSVYRINSFFSSSVTYPEIWRCASPALESIGSKIFGPGPDGLYPALTSSAGDAAFPNCGICDTGDFYFS